MNVILPPFIPKFYHLRILHHEITESFPFSKKNRKEREEINCAAFFSLSPKVVIEGTRRA